MLALHRQVGEKCSLTELIVAGQKKSVIDGLQQNVQVFQVRLLQIADRTVSPQFRIVTAGEAA